MLGERGDFDAIKAGGDLLGAHKAYPSALIEAWVDEEPPAVPQSGVRS